MSQRLWFVFAISLLGLFLELSLIRWLPSQVRALAYFKNLVLISAFLGFGLGFILRRRMRWLAAGFPLLFVLQVAVALLLSRFRITGLENPDEHLWLLYFDLPETARHFPLSLAIPLFYVLNTLTFIPIGQLLASAMSDVGDNLAAYLANIAGSIAGTALSVVLSFAELGPSYWFVPALLGYAALSLRRRTAFAAGLLSALALLALPLEKPQTLWSPYYALRVEPSRWVTLHEDALKELGAASAPDLGHDLTVNGSFHQAVLDFREPWRSRAPVLEHIYQAYRIPYRYYQETLGGAPGEVLVVGAGTGNDVAVALQHGASRVDAVEIDPLILRLGAQYNPSRVYGDRRVRTVLDDARSFLQNTHSRYDLVVFGTLDSQIALSALSTIRLDNYVYTVESLQQARRVLKPDGVLAMYFWAAQDWIRARLVGTVERAFGYAPEIVLNPQPLLFNMVVMIPADPSRTISAESQAQAEYLKQANRGPQFSTDDWPYLYQRERALSGFYLLEIMILVVMSFVAVRVSLWPVFGAEPGAASRFHLPLFFQGMAFLLLETRSISVLSLLFGSTWVVNAVVIGSILFVILLANLTVRAFKVRGLAWPFAGLALALLAGYLFPTNLLLVQDFALRLAGSILVFLSPVFFSSVIFGVLFGKSADVSWAFASNLLGAVVGGFGEYAAAITGLSALSLIALALFVPVVWLGRREC